MSGGDKQKCLFRIQSCAKQWKSLPGKFKKRMRISNRNSR